MLIRKRSAGKRACLFCSRIYCLTTDLHRGKTTLMLWPWVSMVSGLSWPIHGELSVNLIRPLPVDFKLAAAILFLGAEASFDFTPIDNNCDKD